MGFAKIRSMFGAGKTVDPTLKQFAKYTPAAVAMLDMDMRYVLASDRWIKDYHLPVKDLSGLHHYDLFPEILNMPRWLEIHKRCLKGESASCEEDQFTRTNGRSEWVRWEIIPWYLSTGQQGGIMLFTEVITKRKELEVERAALLEREKTARLRAENAALVKEEFLAMVSHELRHPLGVIAGWAELLCKGEVKTEELPQAFETIRRSAHTELRLVDDILDSAGLRRGKVVLDERNLSMEDVVKNALESVFFSAQQKKIHVHVQRSESKPTVRGDATRLEQIIWNLLSNAVRHTPEGGKIVVRIMTEANTVKVVVEDSGVGIRPEFLPHVFDVFSQCDSNVPSRHAGLGLGMSIARSLAELHGGRLTVKSPGLGLGASFTLELPAVDAR